MCTMYLILTTTIINFCTGLVTWHEVNLDWSLISKYLHTYINKFCSDCVVFNVLTVWYLLFQLCGIYEMFRLCGIYELFRLCGIYELFRLCGISELFRLCGIYELFRLCGIFELFRLCGIYELFRLCGIYELFRLCSIVVFHFILLLLNDIMLGSFGLLLPTTFNLFCFPIFYIELTWWRLF
jgi:hypothetical protein